MPPALRVPARHFLSLLLAVLLGLSGAGCVALPLGVPDFDVNDDLATIRVGSTTRAQVVELLGEPEIDMARFILKELHSVPILIVTAGGQDVFGGDVTYRILVRFDDRDIVQTYEVEGADGNRASFGVVQSSEGTTPQNAALPPRSIFQEEGSSVATSFTSVAVSPEEKLIAASSGAIGRVWIEHLETGHRNLVDLDAHIVSLAFSPDGTKLAVLARTVRILDAATGKQIGLFGGHGDEIFWRFRGATALAFAPDGKTVATGGGKGEVKLWDAATAAEKLSFRAHEEWVFSVAFSPDGSLLATAGADRSVRLWDAATGAELARIPRTGPPDTVAFSPNGELLAIATHDHVELWRVVSRQGAGPSRPQPVVEGPVEMFILPVVTWLQFKGPGFRGRSVVFSPDGRSIAACAGGASIWDLDTSRQLRRMVPGGPSTVERPSDSGRINDCAFSPDGGYLATAGDDGVHLWDLSGLRESSATRPSPGQGRK